ncbi:MAG TPA: hypothetical protein VGX69_03255 [Solirubrobacteraceae bacterium]|jgi:hypothetical protein|nr:hypothetical protein [Solirubrobacteraceae bacterium]
MGAVIGTAIAVSELSSITVEGRHVAAVPSVWDVLLPALLGGVGGIVVLTMFSAISGLVSYFVLDGDDVWTVVMPGQGAVELVCRREVPVGVEQLGAVECVIRKPSGTFQTTDEMRPRHHPYGAVAYIDGPLEAGIYEARFYATEHKRRVHEVARIRQAFGT